VRARKGNGILREGDTFRAIGRNKGRSVESMYSLDLVFQNLFVMLLKALEYMYIYVEETRRKKKEERKSAICTIA